MASIRKDIEKNAMKAVLMRSTFMPAFSNKPITLSGIPYLIRGFDIFSEALGLAWPRKNPNIKNGTMFIKSL